MKKEIIRDIIITLLIIILINLPNIVKAENNDLKTEEINFINLKKININNTKFLINFDIEKNSVDEIIKNENQALENGYTLKFYNGDTEITGNTKIGTGTIIKLMYNNDLVQEYTALIYGDTTGDGSINAVDALEVIKNKIEVSKFQNEIYEQAGRVTTESRKNKTTPNAVDALAIVKHKLNIQKISQYKTISNPQSNKYITIGTPINNIKDYAKKYSSLYENEITHNYNYYIGSINGCSYSMVFEDNNGLVENIGIDEAEDKQGGFEVFMDIGVQFEDIKRLYRNFEDVEISEDENTMIVNVKNTDDISIKHDFVNGKLTNITLYFNEPMDKITIESIKDDVYNHYCTPYTYTQSFSGITIINGIKNSEDYGKIIARFSELTESMVNNWNWYLLKTPEKCIEHYNYIKNLGNATNINLKYNDYTDLIELWTEIYDLERNTGRLDIDYGVPWLGSWNYVYDRLDTDFYGNPFTHSIGTHYGKYKYIGLLRALEKAEFKKVELITDEERNWKEIIYVMVNDSSETDEIATFNNKFKEYEGIIDGTKVIELIKLIENSNIQNDNQININGIENERNIGAEKKYQVTFIYKEGYIDTINIKQQIMQTEPEEEISVSFALVNNKIKITAKDSKEMSYLTYRWNTEMPTMVKVEEDAEDKKILEVEVEIPGGLNTLTVVATNTRGQTKTKKQDIEGITSPKITVEKDGEYLILNVKDQNGITLIDYILNEQQYRIDLTLHDAEYFNTIDGLTVKTNSEGDIIEVEYRQLMNDKGMNVLKLTAENKKKIKATFDGQCDNR